MSVFSFSVAMFFSVTQMLVGLIVTSEFFCPFLAFPGPTSLAFSLLVLWLLQWSAPHPQIDEGLISSSTAHLLAGLQWIFWVKSLLW